MPPLKVPPLTGEPFCFKHHPDTATARIVASVKGGRHRKRPEPSPSAPTALRSIDDAVAELEALADDAKKLHHGAERVKVLTAIIRTALDAHASHSVEKRLVELEARETGAPHLKRA